MLPHALLGNAACRVEFSRVTSGATKWLWHSWQPVCHLRSLNNTPFLFTGEISEEEWSSHPRPASHYSSSRIRGPFLKRPHWKKPADFNHDILVDGVPKGTCYPTMERMKAGMGAHSGGPLTILGIETSFDDTAVAVVDENKTVLGAWSKSQHDKHVKTGGVVPLVAGDLHKECLEEVTNRALEKSGRSLEEVGAIAVTVGPGLKPCLVEGINYAKELARKAKIPFPFLTLICSGGHCILAIANSINEFVVLGQCLDDSPGEALDKCARSMQLHRHHDVIGLSGGAAIEKLAEKGDKAKIKLMKAPIMSTTQNCNFSFSGLKRACGKLCSSASFQGWDETTPIPMCDDLSAAVQDTVLVHLCQRTERALLYSRITRSNILSLVASGGVVSNKVLVSRLEQLAYYYQFGLYTPPLELCTDNGIMIAWAGLERVLALEAGTFHPRLDLEWMEGLGVHWSGEGTETIKSHGQLHLGEDISDEIEALKLSLSKRFKRFQKDAARKKDLAKAHGK